MTSRLEVNETQRRNLFADVAHELRTPLSIIRGNTEGMLDGVYPRDDTRLETILDATAVMSRLLDDLRTLSLTDTGALRLHKQTTDVADLLDDIRYGFTPRASEAGVAFTISSVPLPPLDIDPVRVRQVLENLLDNALRHTPRGGTIRIEVGREGPAALFRVADTGRGIPAEALPHVFDRFWKSADSGGSGLGLAIARGLVEAHGGKIRADSVVGRGTVVSFTLPVERGRKGRGFEEDEARRQDGEMMTEFRSELMSTTMYGGSRDTEDGRAAVVAQRLQPGGHGVAASWLRRGDDACAGRAWSPQWGLTLDAGFAPDRR